MGLAVYETQNRDQVLPYHLKSLQLAEKENLYRTAAANLTRIANYYRYVVKDSTCTINYLLKSAELCIDIHNSALFNK